ncbi:disulfide bond formation protein B [Sphingomonas sp.]|uniref:disulfide bond formation protein B n=1 Tax=Sphingomonas sp. TaxID=28214 RepID=UPI0025F147CB|nr:disulfide bond formation protein B [Sphingomonas sp.]
MAEAVAAPLGETSRLDAPALARLLALLVPAALVLGAFGSQYLGGLYPCEMCWWQRYAHMAGIAAALIAFTAPASSGRSRTFVLLAALAIAVSGAIAVYHAGVELHIFEGVTTCTATAHGKTTAELFQQIMKAPLIRCDEVQWTFLGISLAGWNAIISLPAAALIAVLALRERRA